MIGNINNKGKENPKNKLGCWGSPLGPQRHCLILRALLGNRSGALSLCWLQVRGVPVPHSANIRWRRNTPANPRYPCVSRQDVGPKARDPLRNWLDSLGGVGQRFAPSTSLQQWETGERKLPKINPESLGPLAPARRLGVLWAQLDPVRRRKRRTVHGGGT